MLFDQQLLEASIPLYYCHISTDHLCTKHCALTVKLQSQATNQNINKCTAHMYINSRNKTDAYFNDNHLSMTFKHLCSKVESAICKYSIINV